MSIIAERIGIYAREALEREARLSPKPGLVDAENNGAHTDMDLDLLFRSAEALEPYFARFAAQGMADAALPPDGRLSVLRSEGREAERAMLIATNGINTHKGALFLLGVLCYAAGYSVANGTSPTSQTVCSTAARVCSGITQELGETAGRAYARYGARGARGEAEEGFPHALLAQSAYEQARALGAGEDDAWLLALLHLIETMEDANVLARCGDATAQTLREKAGDIASRYPAGGAEMHAEIRALDRDCQAWRASPGGAADVLACGMFLHMIEDGETTANYLPV